MKNIYLFNVDNVSLNFFIKIFLIYKILLNLRKYILLSFKKKSIKKYRGSCKSRNAIIFANGPSVNKINYQKLNKIKKNNNIDIFCINNFVNSDVAKHITPDYYVIADPTYFKIFEDWQKKFIEEIESEEKTLSYLKEKNIITFVPVDFEKYIKNSDNFYFFNSYCHPSIKNVSNPIMPMGCYPLAAMYTLSIAIYMGYETISIIGFDHSNFKNLNIDCENNIFEGLEYFYSEDAQLIVNYPKSVYNNISDYFLEYSIIFNQYNKYSNYEVYNMNYNGYIDAFDKKDLFSLLK